MRNRILLMAIFVTTLAGQTWAANFDFSADCSSGQTLYYKITSDSTVCVTYPHYYNSNYYYGYDKPTGDLVIPETVTHNELKYAVTSIGANAFNGCIWLAAITISNSITSIDDYAFSHCSKLVSVNLENSIKNIGSFAFENCSSLKSIEIPASIATISPGLFNGCTSLAYVTIPNSITEIGGGAFYDCVQLVSVSIPESVTDIGSGAFYNCLKLESIKIPNSVKNIGDGAFRLCRELKKIVIPDSVKIIGDYTFYGCRSLMSIELPDSLTDIGNYAFYECGSLKTISIPDSVKLIGVKTFKLSGLTSIRMGNAVTGIDVNAFENCRNLRLVNMGASVVDIIENAFNSCSNLSLLVCHNTIPPTITNKTFPNVDTVYVPEESVSAYKSASVWSGKVILPICDFNVIATTQYSSYGSVLGTGKYTVGELAVCLAVPAEHYHFAGWSDGNTANPRIYTIETDIQIEAIFEIKSHIIIVTADFGEVSSGSNHHYGDTIIITAKPYNGYHFVQWGDSETANPRSYIATCDTSYFTAIFEPHRETVDSVVAATCTTTGLTEGSHCSICNEILVAQGTIAALGHTEVVDVAVAATCTKTGLTEGKHCSVCNEILLAQDTIDALGHTEVVDASVAATCTTSGLTEGKYCSVCRNVIVAQTEIPALSHEFVNYVYNNDATTEVDGTETATCERGCGATDTRVAEGTKLATTAVSESAANVINIYAHNNSIVVENATEEIFVYNAMGALIGRGDHNICTINVNTTGIYIVKIGGKAKRVMVK